VPIPVTCEYGHQFEAREEDLGRLVWCPVCGGESIVSKPPPAPEVFFMPWEPEPASTSGKAIASLLFGVLFFFACLSGVPAILLGWQALKDIDRSGGRLRGRGIATGGIVLGLIGCLLSVALFMPAIRSSREAARRSQCINDLKQIGLAMHNYHEANGCLPPAAITDKNGRPLLSWRVAILPYMEESALFSKFRLDEPWDSPHNFALLDRMPPTFACPSDASLKSGKTGYQVVVGPSTAFTPDFKPLRFQDVTDGLGTTLLVGESLHTVPWTKPEDLPFDMTVPLSGLGSHHGYHNNGFNALFGDGSVKFLKSTINPSALGAILTRNGNDGIYPDSY
jgi:prepilin-type processing-associated H-X9-DG protein